jgi:hypothetical protein
MSIWSAVRSRLPLPLTANLCEALSRQNFSNGNSKIDIEPTMHISASAVDPQPYYQLMAEGRERGACYDGYQA